VDEDKERLGTKPKRLNGGGREMEVHILNLSVWSVSGPAAIFKRN
jgi:hypothetical protein